ncbi:pyridoxal-phosphate-dependent aminotransferase family protein [Brachyspira pilosicoli]|uniref:pyridoxal-phosphate-dependent aminotransferase family protein n=1 Tax=Brachyspira pilosicoli TaxID=52584 RepID=UPI001C66CBD1|nr:alanine--glyoxylate aminotransferase family protein [Brachyspira pilosicoli]MBW5397106.1 alanine--glyoxylate aminotransferase family protein [Brachyspira pilosicoli]WIH88881.1 alanine--glyoxylate aminotransferase family protein [Brachyspira pilosicoli]
MRDKTFLMIPGPTPVPESALIEMAKHPMAHRSKEFSNILKEVYEDLKYVFQTKNDVFLFTASGTGAMCAALENIVNEGDKVLCLVIGNFGARWAKIAESRGAEVIKLEVPLGEVIKPQMLEEALNKNKDIKIVTLTHSETSTGAANDVKTLCSIIKKHGALSVVDGITSLCAMEFKTDEWNIDVALSGSQKGFMIAPGLSFLTASEEAFKMHEQCKYPSFYFNWKEHKKSLAKDTTPFTPAVSLISSLHISLKMIKEEGIENVNKRHKKLSLALRAAIKTIGLKLFVEDDNNASYAITSILPPEGITVPDIRKTLKDDYDIIVANGQGSLENKIFRIGTLGFVCERDLIMAVGALEASLIKLGYKFEVGSGVKKLIEELNK